MFIFKQKKGVLRLILLCTSIEMQMIDFFFRFVHETVYGNSLNLYMLFGD